MSTKTTSISFPQLAKLLKPFTFKNDTRPALKHIYYNGNYLIATNSHILARIYPEHITELPTNHQFYFEPRKNEIVQCSQQYPETSRLFPAQFESEIKIMDINEFLTVAKEAKKFTERKNIPVKLSISKTYITVTVEKDDEVFEKQTEIVLDGVENELYVNSSYLVYCLELLKKIDRLSHDTITMNISGRLRPIYFKKDGIADMLLLPIRIY
ncbi:DNA polymerase [Geobacillus virus E3]|uniref:DNA polymerase n=1 Tax=Geobacillus virus E3 TaxID=1572712 RepID=UPI000671B567|nr:DNA polymerase [Geobacillus virus E3]AJA41494.1 putative DNA polymerase III beta clamp subunit [Geobacillus virus E3]